MAPEPRPARLPMLVGSLASACVLAIPLGFFAGAMGGAMRGEGENGHSASDSATMGAFAATVGAGLALMVLMPRGCRVARRVRTAAGLAALVQILAAAVLAGAIYALALPQATPFVTALVSALVLSAAAIAVWTRAAARTGETQGAVR